MARFRYRMQSLLDVKSKLETQAKQEFGAAKAALDEELERLEGLKRRRGVYEERAEELLHGDLRMKDIIENKETILRMDDFIAEQQKRVRAAEKKLEEARERLRQVMQERKMHEKLKEHAFDEFLTEEKHQEGKEVDELTSYTYGQRILLAGSTAGTNRQETKKEGE